MRIKFLSASAVPSITTEVITDSGYKLLRLEQIGIIDSWTIHENLVVITAKISENLYLVQDGIKSAEIIFDDFLLGQIITITISDEQVESLTLPGQLVNPLPRYEQRANQLWDRLRGRPIAYVSGQNNLTIPDDDNYISGSVYNIGDQLTINTHNYINLRQSYFSPEHSNDWLQLT